MAKKKTARKRSTKKRPARKKSATNSQPRLPFAERETSTPQQQAEHAANAELAQEVLDLRRQARALYKEAETKLDELVDRAGTGAEFDLGKGRTAVVVDNFARRRTQFKRVGFDRFDLEVLE